MSELEKIFLTSGLTIISGVLVLIIGQFYNEIIIKPYIEYKKVVGKIDEELVFYSNIYSNAGSLGINNPIYIKTSDDFRRIASRYSAAYNAISCRSHFISKGWLVDKEKESIIVSKLIFISNSLWNSEFIEKNLDASEEIRKILKI